MKIYIPLFALLITPIFFYGGSPIIRIVEKVPWHWGWGVQYIEISYIGDSITLYPDRDIDDELKLEPINSTTYWAALDSLRKEARLLCDSTQIQDDEIVSHIFNLASTHRNAFISEFTKPRNYFTRIILKDRKQILLFPQNTSNPDRWIIMWGNSIFEASKESIYRFNKKKNSLNSENIHD